MMELGEWLENDVCSMKVDIAEAVDDDLAKHQLFGPRTVINLTWTAHEGFEGTTPKTR